MYDSVLVYAGPGCSSIGDGAMTELGPFRVNSDARTLWLNGNAWNNGNQLPNFLTNDNTLSNNLIVEINY